MKKTLYEMAGVPPTAPAQLIGMSIKRRLEKLKDLGTPEATAESYALRECWTILKDPAKRAAYDAKLAAVHVEPTVARNPAPAMATGVDDGDARAFPWKDWTGVVVIVAALGAFNGWRGHAAETERLLKADVEAALAKGPVKWKPPAPKP